MVFLLLSNVFKYRIFFKISNFLCYFCLIVALVSKYVVFITLMIYVMKAF